MRNERRRWELHRAGMRVVRLSVVNGLLILSAATAAAQEREPVRLNQIDDLPIGTVIERVGSASDSSQSYALYLPSYYDPERTWPVLFVMDPRSRALLPLERLVESAERLGFILMSSYNTASDYAGPDPNEPAFDTMLEDAQALLSIDSRRLYVVGFSGTARAAWSLAMRAPGRVAGIIGVGGSLPQGMDVSGLRPLERRPEFGFFGIAGRHDFAYEGMVTLESWLDEAGIPNALAFFEGSHSWAPEDLLGRAVEWMEVRAMQAELRPVDPVLVGVLYWERMAHATRVEAAGDTLSAFREYDQIVGDYRGLTDVADAQRQVERLGELDVVRHGLNRAASFNDRFWSSIADLSLLFLNVRLNRSPPDPERILEEASVPSLSAEAADAADPAAAAAASRLLEHIFVHTSFYLPLEFIEDGRTEHAMAVLDVAEAIFPDRPRVCHFRARALVPAGRMEDALEAVRCALDAGLPPGTLENDPGLGALRELPAFTALVRGT